MAGWLIFAGSAGLIIRRGRGRSTRRDGLSLAAMVLQGVGFAFAWGGMRRFADGAPPDAGVAAWVWAICAAALAIVSGSVALAAVLHLGRQWSLIARVAAEHQLITSGPYAVVRHPIYTAMLGLLVATGIIFSSLPATLAGTALYLLGTMLRTRIEERLLIEAFGDRYRDYRRTVPALIPSPARCETELSPGRDPEPEP